VETQIKKQTPEDAQEYFGTEEKGSWQQSA